MPASLVIGLVIVVAGVIAARLTLFSGRSTVSSPTPVPPGTLTGTTGDATTMGSQLSATTSLRSALGVRRPGTRPDVRVRWYQRVRAGVLLVLLTIGFGMAIGAALGMAALIVSFVIG